MRLVTVATRSQAYFPFLLRSVARFRDAIKVLGWGEKWQGFAWRAQLVAEYVDSLPDEEVVCVIDAYDVLMLRGLDELECAFRRFAMANGVGVVVGCEKPDSAFLRVAQLAIFSTCRGRPVNAGTYVGFVRDVRRMLRGMHEAASGPADDDQVLMTRWCACDPRVHVDCRNRFFLTVLRPLRSALIPGVRIRGGRVLEYGGHRPFFVHGNGQTDMNDLLEKLGYTMSAEEKREIRSYLRRTTYDKVFVYMPFVWPHIAVCIACIAVVVFYARLRSSRR